MIFSRYFKHVSHILNIFKAAAPRVEDSLGNPSGTLTLTCYDPLAQLEALG